MEIEVEFEEEVELNCPLCIEVNKKWTTMKRLYGIEDECPVCKGKKTIWRTVIGITYVEIEPSECINEGML